MKRISSVFKYIYYYLTSETKELRAEAYKAAEAHYNIRPLRNKITQYPRVVDYEYRRREFQAYQRGYINQRCHDCAIAQLALTTKRTNG